jgi:hypothetical protein
LRQTLTKIERRKRSALVQLHLAFPHQFQRGGETRREHGIAACADNRPRPLGDRFRETFNDTSSLINNRWNPILLRITCSTIVAEVVAGWAYPAR